MNKYSIMSINTIAVLILYVSGILSWPPVVSYCGYPLMGEALLKEHMLYILGQHRQRHRLRAEYPAAHSAAINKQSYVYLPHLHIQFVHTDVGSSFDHPVISEQNT